MIIGPREQIFEGEPFATGLARALRAVVRVTYGSRESSSITSGWMLTPRLVMVPGYAVEPLVGSGEGRPTILVQAMKKGKPPWVEQVTAAPELLGPGLLGSASPGDAIALLRLSMPRPGQLVLGFESRQPGDFLSLLHFPYGRQTACVSFGRLISIEEPLISYDAGTQPGSGGGPVLDARCMVIGMHMLGGPPAGGEGAIVNRGLSRAALVEALQRSAWWPEIARYHRLADVAAARQQLQVEAAPAEPASSAPQVDRVLVRAALTASVDPATLTGAKAERLRPHVVDPAAKRWVLRLEARQAALRSVGSLAGLRKLLPRKRDDQDASRAVVERVLAGPPFDLAAEDEESLSWWIQVSRWFQGVAPDLPTPAEITRALERRRVRSRLSAIAGAGFRGRAAELATLREWFAGEPPVPLSVTGIGGVGKSALVARFASELPADTLLLWLDFDRADLAPDDAVSVLRALGEQAAVQLAGFEAPAISATDWQAAAQALGEKVAAHLTSSTPPLLVLDSFEVAQYAERHEELWPVLEVVATKIPTLRLVVTGRAPVKNLNLLGRPARSLALEGLAPADARAWLQDKEISDDEILDKVVDLADGIPLILRLALRLMESGGGAGDLPEKLAPEIVVGFLYGRILDRVQDPELKPVATAALVLRRLTVEMIEPVLGGLVEFPTGEPATWFADLGREMALVEGTEVLRLRPEVRAATLPLLERDRGDLVRAVDERAARWYADQERNPDGVEIAAELVYHRLRLGDVPGAEAAWRDGCGALLQYAAEELPPGPREWLQGRLGEGTTIAPVKVWEQEAAERIRSSRARGLKRAASKILEERIERTDDSPLVFHEAFEERSAGFASAAIERLEAAGYPPGPLGRDRRVLRALLAADQGDRGAAERHLAAIGEKAHWSDRPSDGLEALSVQAARVRLAADLDAELALLSVLQGSDGKARLEVQTIGRWLSSIDVLLPQVVLHLSTGRVETALNLRVSEDPIALQVLSEEVERKRQATLPDEPPKLREQRKALSEGSERQPDRLVWSGWYGAPARSLMALGWHRWRIATTTPFLAEASRLGWEGKLPGHPLAIAILGSLALFIGSFQGLVLVAAEMPVFELLQRAASRELLVTSAATWEHAQKILAGGAPDAPPLASLSGDAGSSGQGVVSLPAEALFYGWKAETRARALAFHLLSPDPLEHLALSLAGEVQQAY